MDFYNNVQYSTLWGNIALDNHPKSLNSYDLENRIQTSGKSQLWLNLIYN